MCCGNDAHSYWCYSNELFGTNKITLVKLSRGKGVPCESRAPRIRTLNACVQAFKTNKASDSLKQLTSRCSKKEEKRKLTVNTGQVMFSGKIYYY